MKNLLAEPLEFINKKLADVYGTSLEGTPIFRISWSEDQLEKRWTSYTDEGIQLIHPEVREYPKYRQWIHEKYLLERLTIIPVMKEEGAPVETVSYEPIWVFEDGTGNYLPPRWAVAKWVVDTLYAALGKESLVKYKDELVNEPQEVRDNRLNQLQTELFGNETSTGDALAYKEGVSLHGPRFQEN